MEMNAPTPGDGDDECCNMRRLILIYKFLSFLLADFFFLF